MTRNRGAYLPLEEAHDGLPVSLLDGLHALPGRHVPQLDGARPVSRHQAGAEGQQRLNRCLVPPLSSCDGHLHMLQHPVMRRFAVEGLLGSGGKSRSMEGLLMF